MARDGLLGPVAGAGDDPFGWIPVTVSPASGGERSSDAGALADRIAIRPVPLTRKNALFAGNDDGAKTWARCASLLGTCKLNGVNPQTYLTVTLRRIVDMHPMSQVDDLMPWNCKHPPKTAGYFGLSLAAGYCR